MNYKHIVYNPMLRSLSDVISGMDEDMVLLRVVVASAYESVAVFEKVKS